MFSYAIANSGVLHIPVRRFSLRALTRRRIGVRHPCFSRRLFDRLMPTRNNQEGQNAYVNEVLSGEWEGHTESLLPSIAVYRGFAIEDLGRNEVYTNSALDRHLSPGTFVWLPWKRANYHEEPNGFEHGFLHHPIKPDPPFAKRVASHLMRMAHFARLLP